MPASSLREAAQATVSSKPGHRGEREVSRKTIARGMPGRSGVTVVTTLVCFFHLHARLRAHRAPGIPCALCLSRRERLMQNSDASRREIAERCLKLERRHCEERSDEAIHPFFGWRDGLLRFARNDGCNFTCDSAFSRRDAPELCKSVSPL